MSEKYIDEIKANLIRADEAINAAMELVKDEFFDSAASRAYYAAFYAATALLLKNEMEFKKHGGVISTIHLKFVKTGILDKEFGKDLNWLFELRDIGDYGVTMHVQRKDAEDAIKAAKRFVDKINEII